jgi:hypothetical protein
LLNLYRIMTAVRAGSHERTVAVGQVGVVTLWVRARSEAVALAQATFILTNRRYASIGMLTCYAEVLHNDPFGCLTEDDRAAERRGDWILDGYDAMKERALSQADGLHEVWLSESDAAQPPQQKLA